MAKPDDDKQLDSLTHHEERKTKMREEHAHNKQEEQNRADQQAAHRQNQADEREIKNYGGIIKDGETREELLARIRQVNEEKPPEAQFTGRVAKEMIEQFELEQKAGREAVARAEKQLEATRERQRQAEAEEGEKKGADDRSSPSQSRHG